LHLLTTDSCFSASRYQEKQRQKEQKQKRKEKDKYLNKLLIFKYCFQNIVLSFVPAFLFPLSAFNCLFGNEENMNPFNIRMTRILLFQGAKQIS